CRPARCRRGGFVADDRRGVDCFAFGSFARRGIRFRKSLAPMKENYRQAAEHAKIGMTEEDCPRITRIDANYYDGKERRHFEQPGRHRFFVGCHWLFSLKTIRVNSRDSRAALLTHS